MELIDWDTQDPKEYVRDFPLTEAEKQDKRMNSIREYLKEIREYRTEEEERFYMDALKKK